jgi:hypothetical protein
MVGLKPEPELRRGFKDKKRLGYLANYSCQVCQLLGENQTTRTELHHLAGIGAGMKASDLLCLVLCQKHHTGKDGVHSGIAEFEAKFKSQLQFIFEINERIFKDRALKGRDLERYYLVKNYCENNLN